MGKLLRGRPLYRYNISEVNPSGWHRVDLHWDFEAQSPYAAELSNDAHKLLDWLRQWCATNRIRLAYSLPWTFVPAEQAGTFREHSRNLLLQIAAHVPVLKDPALGAYCVRERYSDTALHLDAEGAALRTDTLAQQLTNWSVWSSEELAQLNPSESVAKQTSFAARPKGAATEGN